MKKFTVSFGFVFSIICGIVLLLNACGAPVATDNNRYFTGIVYDKANGLPLTSVTCVYNGVTVVTGSNGRFSFNLGSAGGTVTSDASIYKSGYVAYIIEDLVADATKNTDIILTLLTKTDTSTYPTKTVTGKIYDSTGTELAPNTQVLIAFGAANNLCSNPSGTIYNGGYSVSTRIVSPSAIISATVYDSGMNATGVTVTTGNDMSVANPVKNLYLPSTEIIVSNVSITPSEANTMLLIIQEAPGLFFSCPFKSGGVYSGALSFATTDPQTVNIVNFFPGSKIFLVQRKNNFSFLGTAEKNYWQCGSITDVPAASSSIVLPAIVDNGPTTFADGSSMSYSGGVLSVSAIPSANCYIFSVSISDGIVATNDTIAAIASTSNTITLPAWLQTLIASNTVTFSVNLWNNFNFFIADNYRYPFGLTSGYILGAPDFSGAEVYDSSSSKDITVP